MYLETAYARRLAPGWPTVERGSFAYSVIRGLTASRKTLECKYFYDEQGSELFDDICRQPEYYPTRSETEILTRHAAAIAAAIGPGAELVELGSGASLKTRIVLGALQRPAAYVPVDISADYLRAAAASLAGEFPGVAVSAVVADFTTPFDLPRPDTDSPRLLFFPGSTIGNFHPAHAERFLRQTCRGLAPDALLIGVDLKKDSSVLESAYNDVAGVTAAFNLNLLQRINRELDATFDLTAFEHQAFYTEGRGRVEMHLRSAIAQTVRVAGRYVGFAAHESIHTESCYKYSVAEFLALTARAGWQSIGTWLDYRELFSVHLLRPVSAMSTGAIGCGRLGEAIR